MAADHSATAKDVVSGAVKLSQAAPGIMKAFNQLGEAAYKPGALDAKTKELVALGISIAVGCEGCVAYHTAGAVEKGAQRDEVVEAIGTAVYMGGGPAVVYGAKALEAFDQMTGVK